MATKPRKTTTDKYDEIMKELGTLKQMLAERQHLDSKTLQHEELMNGNGKPGFRQVRDKISAWESKVNAIIIIIVGDVVVRVIQFLSQ